MRTKGPVADMRGHECMHESPDSQDGKASLAGLSVGGLLFIWSIRRWRDAVRDRECLGDALSHTYGVAGCPDAVPLIDEMMSLATVTAFRPFVIRCVPCRTLSVDEWTLLRAMQALQSGYDERAASLVETMVAGRLARALCRSAKVYVECLTDAGVLLTGANLSVVK